MNFFLFVVTQKKANDNNNNSFCPLNCSFNWKLFSGRKSSFILLGYNLSLMIAEVFPYLILIGFKGKTSAKFDAKWLAFVR